MCDLIGCKDSYKSKLIYALYTLFILTEIGVVIEVNCSSPEKEKHVVDVMIRLFNEILSRTLLDLDNTLPNSDVHKLRNAVEQTIIQFLKQGRHVVMVKEKCIMLMIKCTSLTTLVDLLEDYRNDNLTRQLSDLEKAIRTIDGYADVKLEVVIYKDEFWRTMDELGEMFLLVLYIIIFFVIRIHLYGHSFPRCTGIIKFTSL